MDNEKQSNNSGLPLSLEERQLLDAESTSLRDERLQLLLADIEARRATAPDRQDPAAADLAQQALEAAGLLLDLDRADDAYSLARPTVDVLLEHQRFEAAAMACQYVYLSEQFDALPAIGQAAWLSVTYPIDPALTARVLEHIVDETPDNSDGAAVAAAAAHYVVDLRADESQREELTLFTGGLLARVARRHSNIDNQQAFSEWVTRLQLDHPSQFLGRLRNVIDVLVQDDWWFDREALQAAFPDETD